VPGEIIRPGWKRYQATMEAVFTFMRDITNL
jgi:hypothetical protein